MKNVEYIWAPRYEPIKIDHPIGGIIRDIPILQDDKYKNPAGHTSGYVSWHNDQTFLLIDAIPLSKDPSRGGKRTLHVRVKDFSAVLTADEVFDFGQLLNYAGATAVKWGAELGTWPRKLRYIHGRPELEVRSLLPEEIRRTPGVDRDISIELRVGNAIASVGISAVDDLHAHCFVFLKDSEEFHEMRYSQHMDPPGFHDLFRKVLAST